MQAKRLPSGRTPALNGSDASVISGCNAVSGLFLTWFKGEGIFPSCVPSCSDFSG